RSGDLGQKRRHINPDTPWCRWASVLHQVAQETVDAPSLADDLLQHAPRLAVGSAGEPVFLMAEQVLRLPRDNGQRIVDLVACPSRELGQGQQLAGAHALF